MNRFDLLKTDLAGRNLIEASAGTGKTFTIAGIYLRLVLELRLDVPNILVVTFTEAATKELKERIRKRLKEAEEAFLQGESADPLLSGLIERIADHRDARRILRNAVTSFDEAAIFTIHGFCQRMLQENPFESGSLCDTELMTDQGSILREIAQDYWRINCYRAPRDKVAAAIDAGITPGSLLGMAKRVSSDPFASVIPPTPQPSDGIETWLLSLKRGFFDYLKTELPSRKQCSNLRSFDDLLLDIHAALRRKGSTLPSLIKERYQAALIDEFQDTDPVQFDIFDTIYPKSEPLPFFMIGDPKQAIYSFRGADIFAYMKAAEATKARHTLLENWRSEPSLIKAVNSVFSASDNPFLFDAIKFTPVQAAPKEREILTEAGESTPPLKVWFAPRKDPGKPINKGDAWEMLPESVATEISRLLRDAGTGKLKIGKGRAVRPGDIAVLVRANRQAKLMQRALTRRGIPSVLCSAGNLFESEEAAELLRILAAVAEPGHEALLRGALATDLTGVSGNDLAQLMGDERDWEQVLEEFRSYHDTWNGSGVMSMILHFMERRRVRERLLSAPMGERRLTNLLHAVETVHQAQIEGRLGMEGVIGWLTCRITEEPKREEHEIRLETDEAAVQLVTIHKSKGLEYPIVFLPFCWAEYGGKDETALYHDDGRVVLDIGSPQLGEHKAAAQQEALAESLRLLYVALTRGKHRTYLIWGAFKDAGSCALHYLLHPHAKAAKGQVALSDEAILHELETLSRKAEGSLEVLRIPPPDLTRYQPQQDEGATLEPRRFTGAISRDWRVASFTSLASHGHPSAELPDHDQQANPVEPQPAQGVDPAGIFAFPRGAKAGIFLHEIFEVVDFDADPQTLAALVGQLLEKHSFEPQWQEAVCSMVRSVLQAPLGEAAFRLAEIANERRLSEMEFFFPLAAVTCERLRDAVSRFSGEPFPVDMAALFNRLAFSPVQGMLRGFIDLVIEHGGRYYILDWKSNHLGNSTMEYGTAGMRREMEQSMYPLQYLLYTVALDNYLRLRIAGYDYDRHFGGVFYIFLRGVDGTGNGIFADRPPKQFIRELSDILTGGVHSSA